MNISKFYYKKSKVQQLRGFCATVRNNCSIREGAKELGIEESAVSTQIRYLELELGVKLFDRVHGRLYINDNGKKVYQKATNIVAEIDNLFNSFLLKDDYKYNNILRIASYDAVLLKIIPLLSNYIKENNINIKLYNIPKNEAIVDLIKNNLDIIIYPFDFNEEISTELESVVLSKYNSYWCLYKGHPLEKKSYKNIIKEDIINSNFGFIKEKIMLSSFEKFIYECGTQEHNFEIINGSVKLLKEAVKNKLLITILSDIYINEVDKETMIFKNSSSILPDRTYNLVINKRHKNITVAFRDFLINKKPLELDVLK